MLARAAFPAFFFVLIGFILFLLVTLQLPIINSIYLFKVDYPNGDTVAKVGSLGLCYDAASLSIAGHSIDVNSHCTDADVHWKLTPSDLNIPGISGDHEYITKGLVGVLIINAVATAFSGLSLFFGFFAWVCSSRVMEIIMFIIMITTVIIGWLAWAVTCAFTLIARHHISDWTDDTFSAHIGPAFWITLAAALVLTLGICAAGFGMFGRYSRRDTTYVSRDVNAPPPPPGMVEKPVGGRRWPWQNGPEYRGTY